VNLARIKATGKIPVIAFDVWLQAGRLARMRRTYPVGVNLSGSCGLDFFAMAHRWQRADSSTCLLEEARHCASSSVSRLAQRSLGRPCSSWASTTRQHLENRTLKDQFLALSPTPVL